MTSGERNLKLDKTIHSNAQKKLRELLRDLRIRKGYRQQDLADRLGVQQSFVSKYEAGERRLDILELRQVCRVLGMKLSEFAARLEKLINEG